MVDTPRYTESDTWYKGNTHIHSTVSDGGLTFEELAASYADVGYDFLCRTDHWVPSDAAADGGAADAPLLWIDGIELDGFDEEGAYYHVVGLGTFQGINREMGFPAAMKSVRAQGALLLLAHPTWTGNSYTDALRIDCDGVEVYNHVCQWLNGKGEAIGHWNAMLREAPRTLGVVSDDAHIKPGHPGWNGGWVMVQAEALTQTAILESLRAGRFYGSTGPEFRRIARDGSRVHIETSPVQFMRLVGPASAGRRTGSYDGALITEMTFEIPEDWAYAYLEIEDGCGHRAWTNTL